MTAREMNEVVTEMKKAFVDAGVLIAAARGNQADAVRAMRILDDPGREFVSSPLLRLEVIPGDGGSDPEAEFYNIFFGAVDQWASLDGLADGAQKLADNFGLGAIDALNVAAAIALGASEFVTTQPVDRPVHRVEGIDVVAI